MIRKNIKFIIIAGFAGSGKTTLGKILAKKLNYTFIDKDTIANNFTNLLLNSKNENIKSRESDFYISNIMPLEYKACINVCLENLELGNSVVLAAPMIKFISNIDKFNDLIELKKLQKMNVDTNVIWISHNPELEFKRIKERNSTRDFNKIKDWNKYLNSIINIVPDSLINYYTFNNTKNQISDFEIKSILK